MEPVQNLTKMSTNSLISNKIIIPYKINTWPSQVVRINKINQIYQVNKSNLVSLIQLAWRHNHSRFRSNQIHHRQINLNLYYKIGIFSQRKAFIIGKMIKIDLGRQALNHVFLMLRVELGSEWLSKSKMMIRWGSHGPTCCKEVRYQVTIRGLSIKVKW